MDREISLRASGMAVALSAALLASPAYAVDVEPGDVFLLDSFQDTLIHIDKNTGAQSLVFPVGSFANALSFVVEPSGTLLVADTDADEIFRVDPVAETMVPLLAVNRNVRVVTVDPTGGIFVAVRETPDDELHRLDPDTGILTLITSGGFLELVVDLAVEEDGSLLALDVTFGDESIVRVDPNTGSQVQVSTEGGLAEARGMVLENDGSIVVASTSKNALIRVDPATGAQTNVTPDGSLSIPNGVGLDRDASLLVSISGNPSDQVWRVDPVSGDTSIVTQGGFIITPDDVRAFDTGASFLACAGFAPPLGVDPVSATTPGVLILGTEILDVDMLPVIALTAPPVMEVDFSPEQPGVAPTDITATLLPTAVFDFLPPLEGNQFFFAPTSQRWVQAFSTTHYPAAGSYTVSMVSGDESEYELDPSNCSLTYVSE